MKEMMNCKGKKFGEGNCFNENNDIRKFAKSLGIEIGPQSVAAQVINIQLQITQLTSGPILDAASQALPKLMKLGTDTGLLPDPNHPGTWMFPGGGALQGRWSMSFANTTAAILAIGFSGSSRLLAREPIGSDPQGPAPSFHQALRRPDAIASPATSGPTCCSPARATTLDGRLCSAGRGTQVKKCGIAVEDVPGGSLD
jgi:hypothetical protein